MIVISLRLKKEKLQKAKNERTYMSAQRMIYSKPVRELLTQFRKEKNVQRSLRFFFFT